MELAGSIYVEAIRRADWRAMDEDNYKCGHCGKEVGTEDEPACPRFDAGAPNCESYLCQGCMNAPGMVHCTVTLPCKPTKMGVLW